MARHKYALNFYKLPVINIELDFTSIYEYSSNGYLAGFRYFVTLPGYHLCYDITCDTGLFVARHSLSPEWVFVNVSASFNNKSPICQSDVGALTKFVAAILGDIL